MKPEKNIDEILERHFAAPAEEDVELHCNQMFQKLHSRAVQIAYWQPQLRENYWQRMVMVAAAALVVCAAGIGLW